MQNCNHQGLQHSLESRAMCNVCGTEGMLSHYFKTQGQRLHGHAADQAAMLGWLPCWHCRVEVIAKCSYAHAGRHVSFVQHQVNRRRWHAVNWSAACLLHFSPANLQHAATRTSCSSRGARRLCTCKRAPAHCWQRLNGLILHALISRCIVSAPFLTAPHSSHLAYGLGILPTG